MKYSWILFDVDETLFDFERAEFEALRAVFAQFNLPFLDAYGELYHRCNDQVWVEFERGKISAADLRVERFRRMFAEAGLQQDPEAFSSAYLPALARGTYLLPGALEVIAALRGHCSLGLLTNGLRDVQRPRIAASALAGRFDVLVISEEVGVAKPHAGIFDAAFAQMGQPGRGQVLMVGDSLTSDIQGGRNYGLDTCWFNPKGLPADPRFPPTFTIRSLTDVLDIVGLNGASAA